MRYFSNPAGQASAGRPRTWHFTKKCPVGLICGTSLNNPKTNPKRNGSIQATKLPATITGVVLAEKIAAHIEILVNTQAISGKKSEPRPIAYGDFLILVQRRSELFHQIIRACKSRDLPIAGADRLKIGAEIAVKDLQALMAFLALPQDSLSLAAALRSPLFGVSEAAVFNLAQGRPESDLWPALVRHQSDFQDVFAILDRFAQSG